MRRDCLLIAIVMLFALTLTACGGGAVEESEDAPPVWAGDDTDTRTEVEDWTDTPPVGNEEEGDAPPESDSETQTVQDEQTMRDAQAVEPTPPEVKPMGEPIAVRELAYDARSDACTVYVLENRRYVPFLVLSADYGGNTLLLRRDVLPEAHSFNRYSAVYEDSDIDRYLNREYAGQLAARDLIRTSEIVVTEDEALGASGTGVRTIARDVFLLSCAELGVTTLVNAGTEGDALAYFAAAANRTVRGENGKAVSWWTRTPDTYYLSAVYGVGPDGTIGSGNAYNENGVRPAFCVSPDATAFPTDDLADGQTLYVLSA